MSDLPQLLKRLEAVTTRLENVANKGSFPAAKSATSVAAASSGADIAASPSLEAFDEIVSGPLKTVVEGGAKIGGLVAEQVGFLQRAFASQRELLVIAAKSKKPDAAKFQELLKPTSELLQKIVELREKNRTSPLFNHLSTVSEGIPALGWVAVEPKPAPYVGEMKEAATFYSNRLIKEYKDKDKSHVEWAQAFVQSLVSLQDFVKKFHTTGLVWNPKGEEAKASAAAPAPSAAPTPVAAAPAPAPGALFGELNKGSDITSGLKKVEKSQMTHKNPALRAGSVVKAEEKAPGIVSSVEFIKAPGIATPSAKSAPKGPAKLALEGNKWVVENHDNKKDLVIDSADLKNTVYIFNCSNSTIQVKSKVNAIVIDGCKKTAIVFDSVVASVEIVNCKSVQVQILGKSPTASIEKTDGCHLYLSRDCLSIEIFSSKSSEMNVSIPGKTEHDDFIERALVEQFKTVVKGDTLVTLPVEHKG